MAKRPVTYAEKSRGRIAATVRDYERRQLQGPAGDTRPRLGVVGYFEAIITTAGPANEADFQDNRYWIKRAGVSTASADVVAPAEFEAFAAPHDLATIVCATNIAEQVYATHSIAHDTPVTVFYGYDRTTPEPTPRYWFTSGGGEDDGLYVRITGATPIPLKFNRWSYSWVEARLLQHGEWGDRPNGRTSANTGIAAYNSIESANGEFGTLAPGYNVANIPGNWTLQPISGTPVVYARFVLNCVSAMEGESPPTEPPEEGANPNYYELIFEAVNVIDGAGCATEEA